MVGADRLSNYVYDVVACVIECRIWQAFQSRMFVGRVRPRAGYGVKREMYILVNQPSALDLTSGFGLVSDLTCEAQLNSVWAIVAD
jgi:hypothetical protein